MDECLNYFRQAIADPRSVPPWSEWWARNAEVVENNFPLVDFVRLKYRRLLGARQILLYRGELPPNYAPPGPHVTGSCSECGERVAVPENGGDIRCANCGMQFGPASAAND